jgi:hypothetical protein
VGSSLSLDNTNLFSEIFTELNITHGTNIWMCLVPDSCGLHDIDDFARGYNAVWSSLSIWFSSSPPGIGTHTHDRLSSDGELGQLYDIRPHGVQGSAQPGPLTAPTSVESLLQTRLLPQG